MKELTIRQATVQDLSKLVPICMEVLGEARI